MGGLPTPIPSLKGGENGNGNGRGRHSGRPLQTAPLRANVNAPLRKLAIVGSHPATREKAPYDDPEYEIWLFNEAPQKPEIYRRWDASFQMHRPEVYASPNNWVNKGHWDWLQQKHGEKQIWMQEVDPRVPNSVKYPMEGVLSLVPYHYIRSTPALALALAIYLGYKDISLYGSELTSNTEYHYQATNLAFWIGLAHGLGIDFHLECWQSEFWQPIYGVEGEMQIPKEYFEKRAAELGATWKVAETMVRKARARFDRALLENMFDKAGEASLDLEKIAMKAGEAYGVLKEAERYRDKTDPISRQEFERVSAKAQKDGQDAEKAMNHAGGKAEYIWNVWKRTGRVEAREQLKAFVHEKTEAAFETGRLLGINRENQDYMMEYDERVTALGGMRAVRQMETSPDLSPYPFPEGKGNEGKGRER